MPRTLLLHIGCHKTGTTTIQHSLKTNSEALEAQGVCFVAPEGQSTLHKVIGPVAIGKIAKKGFHVCNAPLLCRLFAEAPQDKVIASSENFSFFFHPSHIENLAKLLHSIFDRVQIIVYLRRQDSHAVSHHQEGAKIDRQAEAEIFGNGTTALPRSGPGLDNYLNYHTRIGYWLDTFGTENVTVRIWDRKSLVKGDAWHDLMDAAGLDPEPLTTIKDLNVSLGMSKAKIGHIMQAQGIEMDLRSMIMRALPDDAGQMPARADAQRFYERYRDGNIALNARLGARDGSDLFSSDFSSYPEEGRETWTEETASHAIASILDALNAWHSDAGAVQLREAAVLAKRAKKPELAYSLIQAASKLRPQGPLIKRLRADIEVLKQQQSGPSS